MAEPLETPTALAESFKTSTFPISRRKVAGWIAQRLTRSRTKGTTVELIESLFCNILVFYFNFKTLKGALLNNAKNPE
jgi:uncharacterized membrane protein